MKTTLLSLPNYLARLTTNHFSGSTNRHLSMKAIQALQPLVRAFVLTLAALLLCVPLGRAADGNPPERMTYQGYLVDSAGSPLGNTNTGPKNYDVVFRIWNDQSASATANRVWAEQQTITVDKGYFSVLLGEGSAVSGESHASLSTAFTNQVNGSDRFIEVTVKGIGAGGTDSTLLPRMRLLPSLYAFLAKTAVRALSADSATTAATSTRATNATYATNAAYASAAGLATNAYHLLNSLGDEVAYVTTTNVHVTGNVYANRFSGYGTIPVGGIIMWSGASVPDGWALCTGTTVNGQLTPDLRGRFILSSGSGTGLTARTVGQAAGEEKHTLTTTEMPAHGHNVSVATVGYVAAYDSSSEVVVAPNSSKNNDTQTWGAASTGGGAAHNIMPPYYVLAFIMRVY